MLSIFSLSNTLQLLRRYKNHTNIHIIRLLQNLALLSIYNMYNWATASSGPDSYKIFQGIKILCRFLLMKKKHTAFPPGWQKQHRIGLKFIDLSPCAEVTRPFWRVEGYPNAEYHGRSFIRPSEGKIGMD